ncbi:hypothetical protein L2735_12100 [Shewanella olleyana]|uniref:hypothetical protein n=1 Tax=Shewanella olleyana TaxID=135626 RepID=UPI00200DCD99|nr:hypothetical protein [Shewanella olleyana]MCL1067541.1 hypothetical protein [Shewanella olleyana]
MFILKYILVIGYCIFVYKLSGSERSFNNWLFDYISSKPTQSELKSVGIQWLLLSFEDAKDEESLKTCLEVFDDEIKASSRLKKIGYRIEGNIEAPNKESC